MKVFLIEDDPLKAARLTDYLRELVVDAEIQKCGSFQSGLKALELELPALLVLDMTIPTFDRVKFERAGRFRPLGGYDLMRKMKLRGLGVPTIVVTQLESFGDGREKVTFAEISERCRAEFPGMFMGSVYFRQDVTTWQDELKLLIGAFLLAGEGK